MSKGTRWVVGLLAVALGAGCAGIKASAARSSYQKQQLEAYVFPKPCEELWVDALKVIQGHEFMLVGKDRLLVGQPSQSSVGQFLARGHATTIDDHGVFEAESDSDNLQVRYRVRGTPVGTTGCRVEYTGIQFDRVNSSESTYRDYDYELELVSRVAPADGARISLGMDEAAAKATR